MLFRKRQIINFLRRNFIFKTKKQYRIDFVRINGATTEIIKPQFQKLEVPAIKRIKPENCWNMDEAGIIEGQGKNGLVVRNAQKRFIQKKQPSGKTQTLFIKYIFILKQSIYLLIIFKRKLV